MGEPSGALSEVFARWALRSHAPGVAWGLVRDGALVASGGVGTLRVGEDAPPDADSVFRIASMTKSFTGAALMTLVAEGTDPAGRARRDLRPGVGALARTDDGRSRR